MKIHYLSPFAWACVRVCLYLCVFVCGCVDACLHPPVIICANKLYFSLPSCVCACMCICMCVPVNERAPLLCVKISCACPYPSMRVCVFVCVCVCGHYFPSGFAACLSRRLFKRPRCLYSSRTGEPFLRRSRWYCTVSLSTPVRCFSYTTDALGPHHPPHCIFPLTLSVIFINIM